MLLLHTFSFLTLGSLALNSQAALINPFWKSDSSLQKRDAVANDAAPSHPTIVDRNDGGAGLEERARKNDQPLLSEEEEELLRRLSLGLKSQLRDNDLIIFIGNSASYLSYVFQQFDRHDQNTYNFARLPMSGTKDYGTNAHHGRGMATRQGKKDYFKNILQAKLTQRNFNRVVLVDRSTRGESVDGFRRIWDDLLDLAKEKYNPPWTNTRVQRLKDMEMVFINMVDWSRRDSTVAPTTVTQIAKITVQSEDGAIDTLLRDNDPHPRLQPDYPPYKWEIPPDLLWGQHGSGRKVQQLRRIRAYNEQPGRGLINKQTNAHNADGLVHVLDG
ncbi:MAG: hypothetical protein Q9191_000707 [Dirinaria sp. TL-2023a]